jgi:putative chitinase
MTPRQIALATGARIYRATEFFPHIEFAMKAYGIDQTPLRKAMFLSNVGHESGGLHWLVELWGPTEAQRRYEGRKDLGNVSEGDGIRYRGRGLLQITGRYNYASIRDRLRARFPDLGVPDFEAEPEKLALPQWAALTAADYVDREGLNAVADSGDYDGYCDIINRGHKTKAMGDSNGYAQRLALFQAAQEAFA